MERRSGSLLSAFADQFLSPEADVLKELNQTNLRRIFRMAGLLVLAHLLHIAIFLAKEETTPVAIRWKSGIILAHSVMAVWSILFLGITYPGNPLSVRMRSLPALLAAASYLIFGAVVAIIDQLVTPAITPLIVSSLGIGSVILLPPSRSLPLYATQFAIFTVLSATTQTSQDRLLSARVNAMTMSFVGFGLNWLLYSGRLREIRQRQVIQHQRRDLAIRNRALRRIIAGRDRFFSIIAHDLRGPIGSISEALRYLGDEFDELQEGDKKSLLQTLQSTSERSYNLLEDLLYWARSQTGQIPFRIEDFSLNELARETYDIIADRAQRKQIQLHFHLPEGLALRADRSMIHSVLGNLLGNALKFTPRGGEVTLHARRINGNIEISVEDTGSGLREDDLLKVRTGKGIPTSWGTEGETGTGLGLDMVRQFLEKNGGKLSAENKPERGCRFFFTLPAGEKKAKPT